jgi:hypothetical protein
LALVLQRQRERTQTAYSVGSNPTQGTKSVRGVHEASIVYAERTRAAAIAAGESLNSVSKRLGVGRAALRDWRDRPVRTSHPAECPRCGSGTLQIPSYAHLLGLYLGDGCLSRHRREVYALRIACDDAYPRLIGEAEGVVRGVHPGRPGLFNSDGCRFANWTTKETRRQLFRRRLYQLPSTAPRRSSPCNLAFLRAVRSTRRREGSYEAPTGVDIPSCCGFSPRVQAENPQHEGISGSPAACVGELRGGATGSGGLAPDIACPQHPEGVASPGNRLTALPDTAVRRRKCTHKTRSDRGCWLVISGGCSPQLRAHIEQESRITPLAP